MRFLIIFIFLITNVVAEELPGIKNIVIHKIPKTYDNNNNLPLFSLMIKKLILMNIRVNYYY